MFILEESKKFYMNVSVELKFVIHCEKSLNVFLLLN